MAVAYAALGNGGTVVTPHLGDDVESVTGRVLEEIRPAPRRHLDISPTTRDTIMTGLTRAATEPGGTSYPVFGNFPFDVAGKTGTAQRPNQPDQSWYIVLAPAKNPQIVVAVTLERGGFGVDTAAPVAARILEHYFKLPITPDRLARAAGNGQARRSDPAAGSQADDYPEERSSAPSRRATRLIMEAAPLTLTPRRARDRRAPRRRLFRRLAARRRRSALVAFSCLHPRRRDARRRARVSRSTSRCGRRLYALIGIALMLAVAKIDYSRFREIRVGIYSLMIGSICLVLVFGAAARGSRRWIELPYFRFQPSELAKLLLIVALAAFVIERTRRGTPLRQTLRILALGLAPAGLVFLQPDLGTGIVLVVITLAILFLAGVPWRHFAVIGGLAACAVSFVLVIAPAAGLPSPLHGYQQDRLTAFLHPSATIQAMRAIRSTRASPPSGPARRPDAATTRRRPSSSSFPSGTRTSCSP